MEKKTRTRIVIAVVAVVATAVTVFFVLNGRVKAGPKTEVKLDDAKRKPYLVQKKAEVSAVKYKDPSASTSTEKKKKRGKIAGRIGADTDGVFRDGDGNPYPPADQEIMAAAEAAIDKDDLEGALGLAEKALTSSNKELKEMVVDALGWFGESAMAELTPFMSDADEEVAEKAASHWKDALQEISDDGVKAGVVEMSLKALKNKDLLEDVANELIGMDELAAVQVIANVMESGDRLAADAVRDVYDSITGEEWSGVDAAEAWLQENYTPPDDDE